MDTVAALDRAIESLIRYVPEFDDPECLRVMRVACGVAWVRRRVADKTADAERGIG